MTRQEYNDMHDAVGVAMEAYNTLGRALDEHIYQEAFAVEANMRGMDVEREKKLSLSYKGIELQKVFFANFYYKGIILEFKSVEELSSTHRAQLLNYMRISNKRRGILFNFGETNLHSERYLYLPAEDRFVLLTPKKLQALHCCLIFLPISAPLFLPISETEKTTINKQFI